MSGGFYEADTAEHRARLERVAEYMRENPGAGTREVADALGLPAWRVNKALTRIVDGQVVEPRKPGRDQRPRSRPQTLAEIREEWRHDLEVTDGFKRPLRYKGGA
jgi:hypothetical protein